LQKHPWENINERYKIGDKVSGKVVSLTDYGAFIEIEKGIEGLIHVSEMSWTHHITNPGQIVTMGQLVEAQILNIDIDERKLSLGMKQLTPNPWQSLLEKFPVGTKQKGKVCNITRFGVFVELEEGVDGLVHISDISWTKKILDVNLFFKMDQEVEVVILGVDVANQRISLGIKQLIENPWEKLEDQYKAGTEVEVKVMKPIERGIIVEIGGDLDAFLPASQLAPVNIRNFKELFKEGDTFMSEVIEFDKSNKKIVLSVNEYLKDKTEDEITAYQDKFNFTRRFTLKDLQEKKKAYESEPIDFRIEDIIGEDDPNLVKQPVTIETFETKAMVEPKEDKPESEVPSEEVKQEMKPDDSDDKQQDSVGHDDTGEDKKPE
jgi:SSU ribosomal protein S1P